MCAFKAVLRFNGLVALKPIFFFDPHTFSKAKPLQDIWCLYDTPAVFHTYMGQLEQILPLTAQKIEKLAQGSIQYYLQSHWCQQHARNISFHKTLKHFPKRIILTSNTWVFWPCSRTENHILLSVEHVMNYIIRHYVFIWPIYCHCFDLSDYSF